VTDESPEPPTDEQPSGPRIGRVRRAPRYGSFVATGVIVGVVLGVAAVVIVAAVRPTSDQFSENSVIGYVAAILGLIGAVIGAALAVLFDRRDTLPTSRRQAESSPDPR
jgi:hypothetical protein